MTDYPREAWTFGTKTCQIRKVILVEHSRFGQGELDAKGECYYPSELYSTKGGAYRGALRYLARKQQEVDKRQAVIAKQRKNLENQTRAEK